MAQRWRHQTGAGSLVPLPDGIKDLNELGVSEDGRHWFTAMMKQQGLEAAPSVPEIEPLHEPQWPEFS